MVLYDEEYVIKDLETLFKAKLNTEIDLINTEKGAVAGQPLYLDPIPAEKYIFETLDDRILNYKGFFLMYGLVDTPAREATQGSILEDVTVTFQIATFDAGELARSNTLYKLLRYRRALRAVIIKNPDVFRGMAKPTMASFKPSAFPYDNKNIIISIGVDIKASINTF
jgi:hypothetical protein